MRWMVGGLAAPLFVAACTPPVAPKVGDAPTSRDPAASDPATSDPATSDPANWGSDHAGQDPPDFVAGDECLFCHRTDIGPTWSQNRHQSTIRPVADEPDARAALEKDDSLQSVAAEVELVLGRSRRMVFLRRTADYGRLAVQSVAWLPPRGDRPGELQGASSPHWDTEVFGERCAGCHATAVDSGTRAFSALSLDCFVCHGDGKLDHSKDGSVMLLSKKRDDPARVVVLICGQCHVRSGRSRRTGRPYADNFIPGDNLLRDLELDWSEKHLASLSPADRHILENIREVAVAGNAAVHCLSCHDVHRGSSRKHRRLDDRESELCVSCHGDFEEPPEWAAAPDYRTVCDG